MRCARSGDRRVGPNASRSRARDGGDLDGSVRVRRRRRLRSLWRAGGGGGGGLAPREPLFDVARAVGGGGADHGLLSSAQQPAQRPQPGGHRGPHLVGAPGHPAGRQRGVGGRRRGRGRGHGPRRDVDDQVLLPAPGGRGAGRRGGARRRNEPGVGDLVVGAPEQDVGGEHGQLQRRAGGLLPRQRVEVAHGGAAEGARVVGMEPHVDALHVEPVGALGQRPHLLAVAHLGQAHRALQRVLVLAAGGAVDGDGEGLQDGGGQAALRERGRGNEEEPRGRRRRRQQRVRAQVALGVEVEEEDEDDDHEEEDDGGEEHPVADGQLLLPRATRGREHAVAAAGALPRRRRGRRRRRDRGRPRDHGCLPSTNGLIAALLFLAAG
uniref:Uncharacterized protein n=1 Tax=Zea mays TaxID=4577 RepID=C0PL80_MAIZE|nr:unknown [Zea mays]